MKLAIFADVHGKLLLPFILVDLYQKQTGQKVDAILQCGDLGTFPDLSRLDKSTLKYSKINRDELGFYDDFATFNPNIHTFLEYLNLDMICVRGNHEDHDYLDNLEHQFVNDPRFPIDAYGRVYVCKTGWVQKIEKEDESFSFIGIGRIGDKKNRTHGKYIQDYEKEELQKRIKTNEIFDVLITHDKDDMSQRGYGMAEIGMILENIIFYYHFFGHTGEPFYSEIARNDITTSYKIKELEFEISGTLPTGCMIILTKNGEGDFEIEIVKQQFTNQLNKSNWRSFIVSED